MDTSPPEAAIASLASPPSAPSPRRPRSPSPPPPIRSAAEHNHPTSPLTHDHLRPARNPVAVIEGGVISFARAEHTARPVFATDATGVKTWTATPALAGVLGHIAR